MQPPNQTTSRVQQSSTLYFHATNTAKTRPAAPKQTANASSIGRSLLFAKPGLQSVATHYKDSIEWDYDILCYLSTECVYCVGCLFTIGLICICWPLLSNKVKMIFSCVCSLVTKVKSWHNMLSVHYLVALANHAFLMGCNVMPCWKQSRSVFLKQRKL